MDGQPGSFGLLHLFSPSCDGAVPGLHFFLFSSCRNGSSRLFLRNAGDSPRSPLG